MTAKGDAVNWTINDVWNCKACEDARWVEEQSKKEQTAKPKDNNATKDDTDDHDGESGIMKINTDMRGKSSVAK